MPVRRQHPLRVLGELVHVDDVRDRAQLADGGQRAAALDARLEGHQEEDAGAHQHHVVDAGLEDLDELEDLERLAGGGAPTARRRQAADDHDEEDADEQAQPRGWACAIQAARSRVCRATRASSEQTR